MYNNYSKDTQGDLKKNKPSKVAPIANTIMSGVMLVVITVLKIVSDKLTWGLYIGFVIVLIMFPVATWYNSWFARKQKTKMLINYEAETELILEYMKTRRHYKAFDEMNGIHMSFLFDETADILPKPTYDNEKSQVGEVHDGVALVSVGIGFLALEVNPENKEIVGLQGLLPKSIWVKKKLKAPTSQKIQGKLICDPAGITLQNKTLIQILKKEDAYYDPKTGWIVIGERKTNEIYDVVEFAEDCYLVLLDGKVVSLWMKITPDIKIY